MPNSLLICPNEQADVEIEVLDQEAQEGARCLGRITYAGLFRGKETYFLQAQAGKRPRIFRTLEKAVAEVLVRSLGLIAAEKEAAVKQVWRDIQATKVEAGVK